jgi:hypothetical protein
MIALQGNRVKRHGATTPENGLAPNAALRKSRGRNFVLATALISALGANPPRWQYADSSGAGGELTPSSVNVPTPGGGSRENFESWRIIEMHPQSISTSVAAMFAAIVVLASATKAEAKHPCKVGSLKGTYGYTVTGTNVGSGPVATVGIFATDGAGTLSGSETDSSNGVVAKRTVTGTYAVNGDCTGSTTFTDNFGRTTHLDFVIDQKGTEICFIETDPGTVTTGIARKQ